MPAAAFDVQPTSGSRSAETRERLLDAAEQLFPVHGFDGTSLRALTRMAGVSLSAANYHFGSKEELLRQTLRRRLGPLNERRLAHLAALERDDDPEVEDLLDAYVRPIFELRAASQRPEASARMAARLYYDPTFAKLRRELLGPVQERFLRVLERALPGRERADLELAQQLTTGLLLHVMSSGADADGAESSFEPLLRLLIDFAAAGLRTTRAAGDRGTGKGGDGGARDGGGA